MKKYLVILLTFLIFSSEGVLSQSLSVNMGFLNEYYRNQQLLGNIDPSISFINRPLFSNALNVENIYDPDIGLTEVRESAFDGIFKFHKESGRLQLLPISFLTQFNSHHPEGINDGSMVPSRGIQIRTSAGIYFKYGPLSIKLKPELIYARNKEFDGWLASNYPNTMGVRFPVSSYQNHIDLPERFGPYSYKKALLGQSSIRLTVGPLSIGLSNENLWWGPGYKNSLLMTNSASGFMHLTLNTVKPLKTFLGSFEGQLIGGRLEGSGFTENLTEDWRYINAVVFSYQPKWVPGLFLGMSRSFQVYKENMGSVWGDYLPVFSFLSKSSSGTNSEVNKKGQNQLISIFMRWLFPKSHAEIYVEYGREDHSWDTRDFILEPAHSSAFIIGLRKLYALNNNKDEFIQIIGEVSNLALNQTTINRAGGGLWDNKAHGSWYIHNGIKHGYTHKGQLLGSGIGPGSNLQTLNISWNKFLKQIGVEIERYVHNNDFWHNEIRDFNSNWVDLSATLFANWDYKNFLLFGKMRFVHSRNYQWMDDVFNFHMQAGMTYRF